MEFTPELAPETSPSASSVRQRRFVRQKVQNLAYVNLERENGGIIRDVSEGGIAVQTVSALNVEDRVPVRFELLAPRARVEGTARVAWTDSFGQAGMEFLDVSLRVRRQLKDWIFTQLLASAYRSAGLDSVFMPQHIDADPAENTLSPSARAVIGSENNSDAMSERSTVHIALLGSSFSISGKFLSHAVDALILLCAVLLFVVTSSLITDTFPSWPVALALLLCLSTIFSGVYWALFMACAGGTVGDEIARLAANSRSDPQEDQPRFR